MISSLKMSPDNDIRELLLEGERFFSRDKTMEAIECFQSALSKDPANVTALNNLGVIAYQLNDPKLAEDFLVKAVRLNRRDPESLDNLADIYWQQGAHEKARQLMFKALAGGLSFPELTARFPEIRLGPETALAENKNILASKKILVINNLFPPQELGGYGRVLADYTLMLRQRGHQVEVLTSDTRALGQAPEPEPHVQCTLKLFGEWTDKGMVEFPRDRIMTIVSRNEQIIHQVLEQFQPDLCLVGDLDLLSALVFPPIFACHIPVLHQLGTKSVGYRVNDAPRDPFYHVATASQWLKDEGISRGYPFENAIVIHSGAFTKEFQMVLPPATDSLRIVFAGLVNSYKGPQVLVEALHLLTRKNIPFTCTIAGGSFDSQFVKTLEDRVMTLGLADKISFSGLLNRMELKSLYARHNILVFPSLVSETFGISQVEAMAAGLLVVTSAKGGAKEVIEDEVSGHFFKPGDHHALAARLLSVLQDREKWERIALCGQQRALEKFDIEQAVDKLETTFKSFFKNLRA
jgi:glycosyltransferase involved in cell wall biosynthesis